MVVVSQTVFFTATASTNGTPLSYAWDFGDGTTASGGLTASHAYTRPGVYTVTFTATDGCGYTGVATATVTMNPPTLVADFVTFPSPASILVDETVIFTDTSTTDGPSIVAWAWDFGDGGVSAAQHPTHTYTSPGIFTVTLVVTDALGYSDTEVKPNLVTVSPRCIMLTGVTFTYTPPLPLVRAPVIFTATHTPADATQPITYTWDLGDGCTGSGAVVQHTYTVTGTRTVSVTAANPCTPAGVSHQESITIAPRRLFLPLVIRNYR